MSLHDLIRCATCGHPRHMHAKRYSETVFKKHEAHVYMECRGGCGCKGFLDPRAPLTMGGAR